LLLKGDGNIMATFIIATILAVIVIAIIMKLIRDKKNGKTNCGCGCGSCPNSGLCHKTEN